MTRDLTVLLSKELGTIGIWLSWPIGWTTSTCMSIWFYRHTYRKKPAENL
ncbi:MAG: hypothetical protein ACI4F3_07660 [Enterocloster sp.]